MWTEERLTQFARARLGERPLVVVSNREPVSHVLARTRKVVPLTPASGVVTAMEPVMRACGGVWVAHASGDADREVVDERGMVRLPPDAPRYALKRLWLSEEEEAGYYYGFANEGLWPLCHIVHARPIFRPEDWRQYQAVNAKFADAVLEVIAETDDPAVLIQDYHFALLPRLIKEKRPDAHVALFWHIPWPNAEAFGICPWQTEILDGMLGADLVGFHTQFHCNNFLETVDRVVEARIDWEHFSVARGQRVTLVKPFPISVAPRFVDEPPATSRAALLAGARHRRGVPGRGRRAHRLHQGPAGAIRRDPALLRAAPRVPRAADVRPARRAEPEPHRALPRAGGRARPARRPDQRRARRAASWRPIVLLKGHHDHRDVWPFYRWADFVMVTSLHDGMNLVAKEFVSVRDDGDGVLILSRFTGAARELRDALLVNPYDVDEMAEAIRTAIEMPPGERRSRMARHAPDRARAQHLPLGRVAPAGELARLPGQIRSRRLPTAGPGPRPGAAPRRARAAPLDARSRAAPAPAQRRDGCSPPTVPSSRPGSWRRWSPPGRSAPRNSAGITLVWSVVGVAHLLVDVRAWEAVTRYLSEFTSRSQTGWPSRRSSWRRRAGGGGRRPRLRPRLGRLPWVATRIFADPALAPLIVLGAATLVVERLRPDGSGRDAGVRPIPRARPLLGDRGGD